MVGAPVEDGEDVCSEREGQPLWVAERATDNQRWRREGLERRRRRKYKVAAETRTCTEERSSLREEEEVVVSMRASMRYAASRLYGEGWRRERYNADVWRGKVALQSPINDRDLHNHIRHGFPSRSHLPFILLCALLLPCVSPHCHFPALFNFGDSNSDTGGLSATFGPVQPPNGVSFFGGPAGRYSDGRLIVDFIAERLNLRFLSSYVDSIGADFSHGANFASKGATILMPNTSYFQSSVSPFYLKVQTSEFTQFKSRSLARRKQGGIWKDLLPEERYFREGLYTFDIGHNDVSQAIYDDLGADQVQSLVADLIEQFTAAVKSIYEQGGRAFWIHSTGPLGCLPRVLVLAPPKSSADLDRFGCSIPHNEKVSQFNAKLKAEVTRLRGAMPAASFTYVDMYSVKYKLISHATELGFEKPFTSCCGYGGGEYNFNINLRCGAREVVNGTLVVVDKICEDPRKSISWDGSHFSDAAAEWVFNQIADGKYSDPPVPISMACKQAWFASTA